MDDLILDVFDKDELGKVHRTPHSCHRFSFDLFFDNKICDIIIMISGRLPRHYVDQGDQCIRWRTSSFSAWVLSLSFDWIVIRRYPSGSDYFFMIICIHFCDQDGLRFARWCRCRTRRAPRERAISSSRTTSSILKTVVLSTASYDLTVLRM